MLSISPLSNKFLSESGPLPCFDSFFPHKLILDKVLIAFPRYWCLIKHFSCKTESKYKFSHLITNWTCSLEVLDTFSQTWNFLYVKVPLLGSGSLWGSLSGVTSTTRSSASCECWSSTWSLWAQLPLLRHTRELPPRRILRATTIVVQIICQSTHMNAY